MNRVTEPVLALTAAAIIWTGCSAAILPRLFLQEPLTGLLLAVAFLVGTGVFARVWACAYCALHRLARDLAEVRRQRDEYIRQENVRSYPFAADPKTPIASIGP